MEKIKVLIALLYCFISSHSEAQNFTKPPFVKQRLMSISSGLSGGVMIFNPVQDIYVNGSFSYCMEDRIGIRTDFILFIPDVNFKGQLDRNSSILIGGEFHFPFNRFDLSLLLQPGISFVYLEEGTTSTKTQVEPVITGSISGTYYILNNFHVFASVMYLHGNYFMEQSDPFQLDELRITSGIGINIFVNHTPLFQRKKVKF